MARHAAMNDAYRAGIRIGLTLVLGIVFTVALMKGEASIGLPVGLLAVPTIATGMGASVFLLDIIDLLALVGL